ncbi:MAG: hypothetical protein ABWY13_05250, partial [Mesorhizobium sp.]
RSGSATFSPRGEGEAAALTSGNFELFLRPEVPPDQRRKSNLALHQSILMNISDCNLMHNMFLLNEHSINESDYDPAHS